MAAPVVRADTTSDEATFEWRYSLARYKTSQLGGALPDANRVWGGGAFFRPASLGNFHTPPREPFRCVLTESSQFVKCIGFYET